MMDALAWLALIGGALVLGIPVLFAWALLSHLKREQQMRRIIEEIRDG